MQLPKDFEDYTRTLMGDSLYERLVGGLDGEPSVSIRLNPFKVGSVEGYDGGEALSSHGFTPVPWCRGGYYLSERPNFTFDPLLHAGAYYVQEASSMFLDFVLRQLVSRPVTMLDLCAAPGGKTTCAMSALPAGSVLYSNEPIRARANILAENVMKFGHPDIVVTNNYPKDYRKSGLSFDVILTDVPCSGEGMFRKDSNAVSEWSKSKVMECQALQRSILTDIWQCLKPGGLLIYSTCTFNAHEDEENVQWIADELGADPVALTGVADGWNITGALVGALPVYRFLPGLTRGEGLFMAVLRKNGCGSEGVSDHDTHYNKGKRRQDSSPKGLNVLTHGVNPPIQKGKKTIPDISLALTTEREANTYPQIAVDYATAVNFLRREAIVLPDGSPRGIVTLTYRGLGLGFANNLGNRANNLYPQEWRIRSTHIPDGDTEVLVKS